MNFFCSLRGPVPENLTFLSTNGLGGYSSLAARGGVTRCDQGLLVSARRAPDLRITLVHRLRETLWQEGRAHVLSTQRFGDGSPEETGIWEQFSWDGTACWKGRAGRVRITRRIANDEQESTIYGAHRRIAGAVRCDPAEPCSPGDP